MTTKSRTSVCFALWRSFGADPSWWQAREHGKLRGLRVRPLHLQGAHPRIGNYNLWHRHWISSALTPAVLEADRVQHLQASCGPDVDGSGRRRGAGCSRQRLHGKPRHSHATSDSLLLKAAGHERRRLPRPSSCGGHVPGPSHAPFSALPLSETVVSAGRRATPTRRGPRGQLSLPCPVTDGLRLRAPLDW